MIIAISFITRTGYNEQIRLDLGARYIRFLLYLQIVTHLWTAVEGAVIGWVKVGNTPDACDFGLPKTK